MDGRYYKTIARDEYTGDTEFLFSPSQFCQEAKDGLLCCKGRISLYDTKTPLTLEGEFVNGVFIVSKAEISSSETEKLLEYFFEGVKEGLKASEKNKVKKLAKGNLLDFLKLPEAAGQLLKAVPDKKKALRIMKKGESLNCQREMTDLLMELDVPMAQIEWFLRHDVSIKQLKNNPYFHCMCAGIDIYKADLIADSFSELDAYEPVRILGYINDAMQACINAGNSCTTAEGLCRAVNWRLSHSGFKGEISVAMLNTVILSQPKHFSVFVMEGEKYIYPSKILEQENIAIRHMKRLLNTKTAQLDNFSLMDIEMENGFFFNEAQLNVFRALETPGIKLLTGPPGSGKTATVKGLISAFRKKYPKKCIQLAATTGRASRVLAEACGMKAMTVNKLLDIRPFGESFSSKDLNNPLPADLLIVDEVSMMGLELFAALLKAVKSGATLILVGDKDQLQSVEYGNVLEELQNSGMLEVYELTEIMRNSGLICRNAAKINAGDLALQTDSSFHIAEFDSEAELKQTLMKNISAGGQILSIVKKGNLGTNQLNHDIQKAKGHCHGEHITYGMADYYVGDHVIMTKTNYGKGYFNGDMGVVEKVVGNGSLAVRFPDRILLLEKEDFAFMDLSYAVTVHKGQGSGFDDVHIVLPDGYGNMLTRRILYTAVTRAKKNVFLYSMGDAYRFAIQNVSENHRLSLLSQRLKQGIPA